MFNGCYKFEGISLDKWNVSNVEDMTSMFAICKNFEGKGLENWDVSNVKHMSRMFENCENLNVDLSKWGTLATNVRDILLMFYNCKNLDVTYHIGTYQKYIKIVKRKCSTVAIINHSDSVLK